ncbi:hypothetical protein HK102_012218 [Quaeritorhiza haematococci]|nr:hypothetical protein HK102_012218 [Quaeritorhiza haematococci]
MKGDQKGDPATIKVEKTDSGDDFHVFLSYQWDSQNTVLAVRSFLESKGLRVWMDLQQMKSNIYESMVEGITKSRVICPFLSIKYDQSQNCRREIQYSADLRKPLVPVRLDNGPFGVTGLVTAGCLYVSLVAVQVESDKWNKKLEELYDRIRNALGLAEAPIPPVNVEPPPPYSPASSAPVPVPTLADSSAVQIKYNGADSGRILVRNQHKGPVEAFVSLVNGVSGSDDWFLIDGGQIESWGRASSAWQFVVFCNLGHRKDRSGIYLPPGTEIVLLDDPVRNPVLTPRNIRIEPLTPQTSPNFTDAETGRVNCIEVENQSSTEIAVFMTKYSNPEHGDSSHYTLQHGQSDTWRRYYWEGVGIRYGTHKEKQCGVYVMSGVKIVFLEES